LSSAVAFYLAEGLNIKDSIIMSKKYLSKKTKKPLDFVLDNNPMKH
jgi:hydroxymethylpyrimidine/phosphomethylpyrimidine kinase